jgi:hypothetical protein
MKRLAIAAMAALLLIGSLTGSVAGKAGTSILAPDGLHYGDSFVPVSYTAPQHLGPNDFLFASAFCSADSGGGWAETIFLARTS